MSLYTKLVDPLLGVWKIEESSEQLLSQLEKKEYYLPFLANMHTEKRRQEWLATRVLLKEMLGREVRIAYEANGAPYLPDEPFYISISHTKQYAAILIQKHPAVGIDIEYRSDRVLKIRSRFMNPEEEERIDKKHEVEHLLIHWCAKETLFKVIGQEEVDFCRHLHIKPFSYNDRGRLEAFETRTEQSCTYQMEFRVTSQFILTFSR